MKPLKVFLAVMLLAASFEFAGTGTLQAAPKTTFQHVAVRIGGGTRRQYYRRPYRRPIYHRPYYNRWHRGPVYHGRPGWRRPYRRH